MDGNPNGVTLHKTELPTMIEGYLILRRIVPHTMRKLVRGEIWTDSESSMKKKSVGPGSCPIFDQRSSIN